MNKSLQGILTLHPSQTIPNNSLSLLDSSMTLKTAIMI